MSNCKYQMSSFCTYLPKRSHKETLSPELTDTAVDKPSTFFLKKRPATAVYHSRKKVPDIIREIQDGDTILHIDQKIRSVLNAEIGEIPDLYQELDDLIWIVKNTEIDIDRILAEKKIISVRKKIQDIESTSKLGFYIFRTGHLITQYKTISSKKQKSFVKAKKTSIDVQNDREIADIIHRYLRVAKDYIDIKNFVQKTHILQCPDCHSQNLQNIDETIYVCECGREIPIMDDAPTFRDSDRVNMGQRYTYSRRGHFIDAMKRFQGIQNTTIDEAVIEKIKEEMLFHGLDKTTVTKDQIYMFLVDNKFNSYYEDINLITSIVTGLPPPDISNLEKKLLDDFDEIENAYEEIKDDSRIHSLTVNFKLWKLLQRNGYPCRKDDFYMLKTDTKRDEHEDKWVEICRVLKWKETK